jgi:hypothetical protein
LSGLPVWLISLKINYVSYIINSMMAQFLTKTEV